MPDLEATGYSEEHSFTDAFREAVRKLEDALGGRPNHLRVLVKEIGGEYGGVVGANKLFVTVRKVRSAKPSATKTYQITQVDVSFLKKRPPRLAVTAKGTTRTGGYTDPRLERRIYVKPPDDGIQDYDLLATPPSGPSTDHIAPIEATDTWDDFPRWFRGARVHSETNSMENVASKVPTGAAGSR